MNVHFIGIGGIGMSGIARLYMSQGHRVQGSDAKHNDLLTELETLGAQIFLGHDPSYIGAADRVVYSSSIPENHPERLAAVKKGIPVIHRAEALAELCRGKYTVAVSGTHGKTTTTALVGTVLKEAGREPTVVVGGVVSLLGGNACWGSGNEMVIEADESDSSFLKFSPDLAVITNIEAEHLDHFKDLEHIEGTFQDFLGRLSPQGKWIGCAEDERVLRLAAKNPRVRLYGFDRKTATLVAENVRECPDGRRGVSFDVVDGGRKLGSARLKIIGRHNALNALGAIGVGLELGLEFPVIAGALGKYEGAGRRFDVRYEDKNYLLVDDYAHHPTEIRKTLEAARGLRKKRIVAFFQPHRYSRTEFLMKDFLTSFGDADRLIITDIYAASEAPRPGISGKHLSEELKKAGHPDVDFVERSRLADAAKSELRSGDLLILMGAGDINQVTRQLTESLKNGTPNAVFAGVRGHVFKNEPIAKHTSLKIGGPAEYWLEPEDEEDLKAILNEVQARDLKLTLFGAGSNLLAPDEGLKGAVVHLGAQYFRQIHMEDSLVVARAGLPNALFIQFALQNGLGGCEFLLGIPGNIGGALAMNAGSHGQSIQSCVESVVTMTSGGERRVRQSHEIPFRYRHCGLTGEIITEVSFLLPKVKRQETQARLEEYRQYRAGTQDLRYPSAGCMFKNPEIPGCSSGRLIDEAGLKGFRIGNAKVSEKHANFIVNLGGATAKDVTDLIREIKTAVKKKSGVELETEVKILQ